MFLKKLSLVNFKNYTKADFQFDRKVNCFTGRNGCGKTNLLDAIYYLCVTKSNFSMDQHCVRHGEHFFTLKGMIASGESSHQLVCKFTEGKRKAFSCDDLVYEKLSEHIGRFPVVFVAPNDVFLINGGSEERRKFIDGLLSQIDAEYLENLQIYNRLLQQRNALLKQFADQNYLDTSLIQVYNDKMDKPAKYIYDRRRGITEEFIPVFNDIYKVISNERESVSLTYDSQLAKISLSQLLQSSMEKDRILKRTTAGIHKDDFTFYIDGQLIRKFGSQGQQKSFLLAIKLSQFHLIKKYKKVNPLLLLDDFFDRLDFERSGNLLKLITSKDFGQVFITDTDEGKIVKAFNQDFNDLEIFQMDEND